MSLEDFTAMLDCSDFILGGYQHSSFLQLFYGNIGCGVGYAEMLNHLYDQLGDKERPMEQGRGEAFAKHQYLNLL